MLLLRCVPPPRCRPCTEQGAGRAPSGSYVGLLCCAMPRALRAEIRAVTVAVAAAAAAAAAQAGGSFGGKLFRQTINSAAAAVAAAKLRRPVRIQNERKDDCASIQGREPIDFGYTVSFDDTGKLDSLDCTMTMDPGFFYGDAAGDMSMAVGWSDNCYQYNGFKITPATALTDTVHSTAQRAPGCLQSLIASEVILEHVARTVGKPLEEIQALNFYDESTSPVTPFGDHIGKDGYNWTIPTLWSQLQTDCDYTARKAAVTAYNAANRWTKKGIAIAPVKCVLQPLPKPAARCSPAPSTMPPASGCLDGGARAWGCCRH